MLLPCFSFDVVRIHLSQMQRCIIYCNICNKCQKCFHVRSSHKLSLRERENRSQWSLLSVSSSTHLCAWWDPAWWGWSGGCSRCHLRSTWRCLPCPSSPPLTSGLNWTSLHNQEADQQKGLFFKETWMFKLHESTQQTHQRTAPGVWWSSPPALPFCWQTWPCWCAFARTAAVSGEAWPRFSKLHRSTDRHTSRYRLVLLWSSWEHLTTIKPFLI